MRRARIARAAQPLDNNEALADYLHCCRDNQGGPMVRYAMGRLEESVLLAVVRLGGKGYGVTIRRDVNERLGDERSFGAIYATLERLEGKGFVSSKLGEATPERGGKPKRLYQIKARGARALNEARADAASAWAGLPQGASA